MSHISLVQTPVNAAGKKRSTVFFLPTVSLSFTSRSPSAFFDFRENSGALVPTERGMVAKRSLGLENTGSRFKRSPGELSISKPLMPYVWWTVTLMLMFIGLLGTLLPLLPGTSIILAAAVLHHFTVSRTVGWWTLGGLTALTLLSYGVDL